MSKRGVFILGACLLIAGALFFFWSRRPFAPSGVEGKSGAAPGQPERSRGALVGKSNPTPSALPKVDPRVVNGPTRLQAAWGHERNQLGRDRPKEGNPEGPMSLTTDHHGNLLVLDQINGRVVRYDKQGKVLGTVPLTVQSAQDIQVAKDGTLLVMDRITDKSVALMDPQGNLRGELKVEGKGIAEGGGVTSLFVDGTDVYAEREQGDLVRLGDTSGNADPERPEIPGRPTADGKAYVSAGIIDAASGRMFVNVIDRPSMEHRYTKELDLGQPLSLINFLDSDSSGVVYLGLVLHSATDPSKPEEAPVFSGKLLCLDPTDGHPIGQTNIPVNTLPEETFRDLTMDDSGGVLYSYKTEQGVQVQHYDCH